MEELVRPLFIHVFTPIPNPARKPSAPKTSATCAKTARLDGLNASAPETAIPTPRKAGIRAVTAAEPVATKNPTPNKMRAIPKQTLIFDMQDD